MTGFDIAVLLFVGMGAVLGFMRGFVQEILALVAWIAAVFAIRILHTPLNAWLTPHIGTSSGAAVLAFALLLIVPYAVMKFIANWAGRRSRGSVLGPVDRVLGFGFGTVKGVIVVVLAFSVLVLGYDTIWGVGGRPTWITQSRTYPFIDAASKSVVEVIGKRRREAAAAASPKATGSPTDDVGTE
jgi:membrane protein required for colicin V production